MWLPATTFCGSLQVGANLLQVAIQARFVLLINNVKQFFQFGANLFYLPTRAGVKENFAEQAIVFAQNAARNLHVALEGGAWSILVLHDGGKNEGRYEGDAQGVSHRLVVLIKGVFKHVEAEFAVKVFEEDAPHVVALVNDNCVFRREGAEIGKGGAKHGVGRDVATACLFVILLETRLHRSDVGEDAILGQVGQEGVKHREGVFQRHGIDDQFGAEGLNLFKRCEALGVIHEAQTARVDVVNGSFVVETQEVYEECPHFAGAEDKDFHI